MTQPISMPWSSPVFGELPHRWQGVRMAAFPFTPRPGAVERILPPCMEPADGPGMVTLLSYPQTEFQHPFEEALVMVPVRVDETLGNYIPYIYVTTDEALIPGREIAGFPKKLAEVEWGRDGDRIHGSVTRWGKRILSIEGRVQGPMPEAAVAGGGPGPAGTQLQADSGTRGRDRDRGDHQAPDRVDPPRAGDRPGEDSLRAFRSRSHCRSGSGGRGRDDRDAV